jgi:hypothetical protein
VDYKQEVMSCFRACPFKYCISEITGQIYIQLVIVIWNILVENDKKNAWTELKRSHRKLQATANLEFYNFWTSHEN